MNSLIEKIAKDYWRKKRHKILSFKEGFLGNSTTDSITINSSELSYFYKLTKENSIAEYTLLIALYAMLIQKYFENSNIVASKALWLTNKKLLYFDFPIILNKTIKEFIEEIKVEVNEVYKYSNYYGELSNEEKSNLSFIPFKFNYGLKKESDDACYGLSLYIEKNKSNCLNIDVKFSEKFIDQELVSHFLMNFKKWLINLETNKDFDLLQCQLLSEREKTQILVDFNNTQVDYPKKKTIVDLFEEQVNKTQNKIAIEFEESKLTYKELNEKANKLANYISSKYTINKGEIIGVFIPKSDKSVISLLAILKLNAVYLPIDINYPEERIDYLIKDSELKLVISNSFLNIDNCEIINIETLNLKEYSSQNINKEISSNDLAYLIYTSGSTGRPKGVMVEHTSNVNMSLDQIKFFKISQDDKIVWFASVSFDASISEIMMCLYSGATLCIPTEETIKNKNHFVKFLKNSKTSVITIPPSYLGLLSKKDISGLRCIITAGESPNIINAIEVVKLGIDYYNAYGPTECAVCVSMYKFSDNDFNKSIIPIGKPISNTQVYILDNELKPIPIGLIGKIYVSGVGLARGYLNKPELTTEKFIDNPFLKGQLMYDTGDIGCWLADGNIKFIGRKDNQVKLRGYRIELSEIENVILQYSQNLIQTVVEVKEHNQEKVLISYFVSTIKIDKLKLRNFIKSFLPEYMIPSFFIELERLPLTPNGKIDRKALPNISDNDIIRRKHVAPRTKIEKDLAAIFQEILAIEKIGIKDNFFDLGGHSLMVSQVINRINIELNRTVSFKTFFANPTIEQISKVLKKVEYITIPKAAKSTSYQLTASQGRIWILSQLEGGSLAYNMPAAVMLTGVIDIKKFEESFRLLINRHEILRTLFKTNKSGEVRQYIVPNNQIQFNIIEEDYLLKKDQNKAVDIYLQEKNNEPFDLEKAPLLRASIIKLDIEKYVFFLSLHHIIGDGWSIELLISEVIKSYNLLIQERKTVLTKLKIQYKDYSVWLNKELHSKKYFESEKYWLQQFQGELTTLNLPSFKIRPVIQTHNGDSVIHLYSKDFLTKLKIFSSKHEVTLFMTLMAGINALLYRYTGQEDIIVGTPIAGREHPDLENQIGLYLNTLAIRTKLNEGINFLDLVSQQRETLLNAYDHQNYPFDVLVSKLKLKRDTSRSAMFDVLVVLQSQGHLKNQKKSKLKDLQISDYEFKSKTSQLDASFTFVEKDDDGLEITIEYNNDIYDEFLIERFIKHFENLVTQLIDFPEKEIQKIDYLTKLETNQLLVDYNNTKIIYPKDKTIIDLFEDQAKDKPNNIAVVFKETELTYKQLNEKSNQFANFLIENYSIQSNDLIGIKLERSQQLIVAILAILKAEAAYVPIDINYPQERIDYIKKDSNYKVIIDESILEKFNKYQDNYSLTNIKKNIQPHNLAYVIYTSGTTGNPKGVMVEHGALVSKLFGEIELLQLNESIVTCLITNYAFDVSLLEILLPLIIGGKIAIPIPSLELTINDYFEFLDNKKVTILQGTPTYFKNILNTNQIQKSVKSVKTICIGGESFEENLLANLKLKFSNATINNHYGPTEAIIDTICNTSIIEFKSNNIGKPIANTQAYILDKKLCLLPTGVIGKLYVSGNLARGYLNNSELTNEKFIENPFIENERMYDTGDLARWMKNGEIEFLGRNDNQVKIRGYRIELEEIEIAIKTQIDIKSCVVLANTNSLGEKVLVAYIISKEKLNVTKLRSHLQPILPNYMIPSYFIQIDTLPLTPNGKIDIKSLPNPEKSRIGSDSEHIAPRTNIEQKIATIWQNVLGIEKIGVTDNFFELGGHSLSATKVISLIYNEFNVKISIKDFFNNMVLEDQANLINKIDLLSSLNYKNSKRKEDNEIERFEV